MRKMEVPWTTTPAASVTVTYKVDVDCAEHGAVNVKTADNGMKINKFRLIVGPRSREIERVHPVEPAPSVPRGCNPLDNLDSGEWSPTDRSVGLEPSLSDCKRLL